jgi:ATP-dependent DNA helicase RecQ
VARQLTIAGLVQVDSDRFNAIRLTEASRAVLKGERRISLRKWREPAPAGRRRGGAGRAGVHVAAADGLDADAALVFERLRAWRAAQAQSAGVPAYVIFHDTTLREIARNRPRDIDELAAIGGVGARKLERYGEPLLAAVGEATAGSLPSAAPDATVATAARVPGSV